MMLVKDIGLRTCNGTKVMDLTFVVGWLKK